MRCSILLFAASLAAPLTACGYAPPAQTDTDSPKYLADLDACQASVPEAVDRNNAKKGLSWMAGGFTRWSRIGNGIDSCMEARGWGHLRACTPDELRNASKAATLTVTREGVRCADPNRAS